MLVDRQKLPLSYGGGGPRIHADAALAERKDDGSTRSEETMTVHVVIREDQNEYGFIDASVVGLFRTRNDADTFVESSVSGARDEGLRVCGDLGTEPDWQVSWMIESHPLA